jgi:hypothetical protein
VEAALEQEAKRLRPGSGGTVTAGRNGGGSGNAAAVATVAATVASTLGAAGAAGPAAGARRRPVARKERLSKDAYRRQKAQAEGELTRLGLRKSHLELQLGDPSVAANFVELRRVTSELADVNAALDAAENAWLEIEERAP